MGLVDAGGAHDKPQERSSGRSLVLLWLAWAVLLIGLQNLVVLRYRPARPDTVLSWTADETGAPNPDRPYLREPFLNTQVAWDSEYYLSIAVVGYDDPAVPHDPDSKLSLNYAFFPLYPLAMRITALPLRALGLNPIATATLAGVLVSLLGTLAAMLALYDLARPMQGTPDALRAVFYFLIFPMAVFLAQVYTEGLFVGLAFGALALLRRRQWAWAALFTALACWTRAVGVVLIVPLAFAWWHEPGEPRTRFAHGLLALTPLIATLAWKLSPLGSANGIVELSFFGRGFFDVVRTGASWFYGWLSVVNNPAARIYYGLETGLILLALGACLASWRQERGLALFGLALLAVSLFSGAAQSVGRYVIAIPSIYLYLARLGREPLFDRAWTVAGLLLLGMEAALFSFDFWVN